MKVKKLIKKAEAFLNSEERDRKQKKKYLRQVLRKLSKHEKKLRLRLAQEQPEQEASRLRKKLALTHAQRVKGVRLLRELKLPKPGQSSKS